MPAYPWLEKSKLDGDDIAARMRALRKLGDPYIDADIAAAPKAVADKTELDALVAYLQGLGIANEPHKANLEMSPVWGHLAGIVTVHRDARVHRHLDMGVASAAQARIR